MYRSFFFYSGLFANKLRTIHYKMVCKSFGNQSRVYGRVVMYYPQNIIIGENSTLNEAVILNARDQITIGNHVHISPMVIINSGTLDYSKTGSERNHTAMPVKIEDGVWLASGVIINPGVQIGKNSVVGAGAVVTRDIPANSVAVGIPAKVIKQIEET